MHKVAEYIGTNDDGAVIGILDSKKLLDDIPNKLIIPGSEGRSNRYHINKELKKHMASRAVGWDAVCFNLLM